MSRRSPGCLSLFILLLLVSSQRCPADEDTFKSVIRTTDPLTPDKELTTFHLPPGFEIQLVASEPDIAKPMNMAFDARGRLWLSSSEEYPFPAPDDRKPRDTIRVLEINPRTGRADRITTFADGLNIPMGLYPYRGGVIAFSIPHIWHLRDTDGDGQADEREKLFGPMGFERDTHGMCNAFTRGNDGWLYACHGFNNHTTVIGRDGHRVEMQSGNTFRMRLDGSRIEKYSHGLVNPFGMTFDPNGDLFVADCHTKPVSLILQDGYYDSFGKPHDGLGYVPNVMHHLHGSTAIGGIAIYNAEQFPPEYRGNTFGGNVMTSRINRNVLKYNGSTVRAIEQPDFLSCDDPWFRPMELQVGPDGALYVADFYNRIIGHYEVKLDDPRRDRHRGRIWRIVYTGEDTAPSAPVDLTNLSVEKLIAELGSENQTRRNLAADRLVDHFGIEASGQVREALADASPTARVHLLWVLHRMYLLKDSELASAVRDSDWRVRLHAQRIIAASPKSERKYAGWIQRGLTDEHPLVARAAAMAATRHEAWELVRRLLEMLHTAPPEDVHLRHAVRMALRNHLRRSEWFYEVSRFAAPRDVAQLAPICLSLKTQPAADFVVQHLDELGRIDADNFKRYVQFSAGLATSQSLDQLARHVQQKYLKDPTFQYELLISISDGLSGRRQSYPRGLRDWALSLAARLLSDDPDTEPVAWNYEPHPGTPDLGNPWVVSQRRNSADGQKQSRLFSSFPLGEHRTGISRSATFDLKLPFSFYMAGHDGHPGEPTQRRNMVRLCDAATGKQLAAWYPPRSDTARRFQLRDETLSGRRVYLELVDGDGGSAYAWLAVGRFSDARLNPSPVIEQRRKAAQLVSRYKLQELWPNLVALLRSTLDRQSESVLLAAVINVNEDGRFWPLTLVPEISGASADLRNSVRRAVRQSDVDAIDNLLASTMRVATADEQLRLASLLVDDRADLLLSMIESGKASARLLTDPQLAARLDVVADGPLRTRISAVIRELPDEDKRLAQLIANRTALVAKESGSLDAGAALFRKHCAACHQVAGEGKKVGPNLDGIGGRGLARLVEDILAPNRNVDVAFRTSTVVTNDGKVFNGLIRKREVGPLVLVDSTGKEIMIPTDSVERQIQTKLSPMPANVSEKLSEQEFRDLLTWLLSLRATPK